MVFMLSLCWRTSLLSLIKHTHLFLPLLIAFSFSTQLLVTTTCLLRRKSLRCEWVWAASPLQYSIHIQVTPKKREKGFFFFKPSNVVAVLAFLVAGNMFMFHSVSILSCSFWLLYAVKLFRRCIDGIFSLPATYWSQDKPLLQTVGVSPKWNCKQKISVEDTVKMQTTFFIPFYTTDSFRVYVKVFTFIHTTNAVVLHFPSMTT